MASNVYDKLKESLGGVATLSTSQPISGLIVTQNVPQMQEPIIAVAAAPEAPARHRWVAWGLAVATLALAVIVLWKVSHPTHSPNRPYVGKWKFISGQLKIGGALPTSDKVAPGGTMTKLSDNARAGELDSHTPRKYGSR